ASDYKLPQGELRFESLKPASATEVLDFRGKVLGYLADEKLRIYRPLSEIDSKLRDYVVLLEDAKFWHHDGFDMDEIKNAVTRNLEAGKIKRGASTITQQLAKNMFLDKKKSFARKLYEIPWVMRIEKDLSKKQIFELYLNVIEWGPGVHGAEAAARHFFGHSAAELTPGQAMYLALIVPNPTRFDLYAHPKALDFLKSKQRAFVHRLVGEKKIDESERAAYLAADFGLAPLTPEGREFPPFHNGNYFGNRTKSSLASERVFFILEPLLHDSGARKQRTYRTTIDRDLQHTLDALPESPSPGEPAKILALRCGGKIRALRRTEKNRAVLLSPEELSKLSSDGQPANLEILPSIKISDFSAE
ncbi:MAG: transglycosylase domain-containing protein, partial [Bdellovibrionales bacterium]|nr:transglycosylase domain-containing protein [Bdellovibrionales bacterium]